jgi:hypothetical protein
MYCGACGEEVPDNVGFCGNCGAPAAPPESAPGIPPVPPGSVPTPAPLLVPPPPPVGWFSNGPGGPGAPDGKGRRGLWIGIAAAAVIVIAAGVTVPLLLLDRDHGNTVSATTGVSKTTTTKLPSTSSSISTSSTSSTSSPSTSSTTSTTAGAPGDSAGEWVEVALPSAPEGAYSVSVSDQALLVETNSDSGYGLFAYLPGSDGYVGLPVEGTVPPRADLDGLLAVWREGIEDQDTYEYVDTYICAYPLPKGPKVEVQRGARAVDYPQVAGRWISWTEQEPSDFNPEEYWNQHIYVVEADDKGKLVSAPHELVSSAPSAALGESVWVYSLSSEYLAWENAVGHHLIDAGTYVTDLAGEGEPQKVGNEAWTPSIGGGTIVYRDGSLKATDLVGQRVWEVDPLGDFPTAAPTYTAYYRTVESPGEVSWEIVARGYNGTYEQVLAETSSDPYLSAPIAASGARVAFLLDGVVRLFEWRGGIGR